LKRTRAKRGEGERLRAEIIAAATTLLLDTGAANAVSIRAIADAVGVTPPSIYLHFADKTQLLYAVCEEQFRQLDEVIEAAARGATDPKDALQRRARAYVRFGLEHPEAYRILFMQPIDELHDKVNHEQAAGSDSFVHLVGAIEAAMNAGVLPTLDSTRVAIDLWVCVHGVASLLIGVPSFPWVDDADAMVDSVLGAYCEGLAARAAAASASRG
jgi:AcrR family transcriptional regulator